MFGGLCVWWRRGRLLFYNGVNVKFKVNIGGEFDTPRIANERVPHKEELDRIQRMATPRGRVQ